MKKVFLFIATYLLVLTMVGQQQTFDLVTYTPPKGWKKEEKENVITYTKIDKAIKAWCVIGVVKSTVSKGNIDADLESEWNELAVKQYNAESMEATET